MADPSWTDCVGAVTGLVGMATGIYGAIMGRAGYRESKLIRAREMRLALRKDLGEARTSITTLRELMASAAGSRRATLAARGLSRSGNMIVWERIIEADRSTVEQIAASIKSEGTDFAALSEAQLEAELVAANTIRLNLSTLIEKYRSEIAEDDETRRQITQQHTAIAAARIGPKQ